MPTGASVAFGVNRELLDGAFGHSTPITMKERRVIYKLVLLLLGIALLAEVSACRAFFHVCTHARQYDDTGFMLSLIQGFNEHGRLYRETLSRYGPFFSEFYFVIGKLLHV